MSGGLDTGLAGKRALLTGGASGIGGGIAVGLAAEGVHVAIADIQPATETLDAIATSGCEAVEIRADVSREEDVARMVLEAAAALGGINLYVNVAAAARHEAITELTSESWYATLNTNLSACVWACREVSHLMIQQGGGSILMVGSVTTRQPCYRETSYRVSKAGLKAFMEVLTIELAPYGIRVNLLTPGGFVTPLLETTVPAERRRRIQAEIPLRRHEAPVSDIVPSALFLLSDKLSPYTTGAELIVDGAVSLRPLPTSTDDEVRALHARALERRRAPDSAG